MSKSKKKARFWVGQKVVVVSIRRRAIIEQFLHGIRGGVRVRFIRPIENEFGLWNTDHLRPLTAREHGPRRRGK